jgi:hypothetical protein
VVTADGDLARWQRTALVVGAVGLLVCLIGALVPATRVQFFRSWLFAYNLWLGLALGGLVIVMIQYLTGGTWGYLLRRPLEASTRTLPLLAVLFLPLLAGVYDLYPWTNPDLARRLGDKSTYYLNVPFFIVRAALYFASWLVLMLVLNAWSRLQDRSNPSWLVDAFQRISAGGIVVYALTITFASIDWVMSLEPDWYSTIYGGMFGMGQVLSGFAFGLLILLLLGKEPDLDRVLSGINLRDLGSLLLAFVMVWTYLAFSQFLLIWSGNLPEETPWYIRRFHGGWIWLGLLLVLFYFALPFVLLLSTNVKRNRRRLATVAGLVLVMRIVDLFWLIVPGFKQEQTLLERLFSTAIVFDLAALVGIGGVWLGVYLWQVRRWPLLPAHAPTALEGNHHG